MHRQSSKPWEDQEMLYKVHDTLSHIQFPYAAPAGIPPPVYAPAPAPAVAPPPYIPGPPAEPESNYIDPFPNSQPASMAAADEEDDYEFVPVRQRRNQFNKADYAPEARKPIKPQRPPPVFAPSPAPAPAYKPMAPAPSAMPITPVAAPQAPFMPAEGEVIQPKVPAWAGTLSSVGGPKLWDGTVQPKPKPARSVSPQKKAAASPAPSDGFKPTQTKVLDFSTEADEGPRVMHLQYNSPLDMYSKANVEETLQGQTQAAMGGGNTVVPKKTPAEERDWTQSALLRMIYEEENTNVPISEPLPAVASEPRPSPPKKVVAPPPAPTPPPAVPEPEAPVPSPVPAVDVSAGYSDF